MSLPASLLSIVYSCLGNVMLPLSVNTKVTRYLKVSTTLHTDNSHENQCFHTQSLACT